MLSNQLKLGLKIFRKSFFSKGEHELRTMDAVDQLICGIRLLSCNSFCEKIGKISRRTFNFPASAIVFPSNPVSN